MFYTSQEEASRGRAGLVRGEVRRPGPGGQVGDYFPRAVRRHARGQVRPARPHQGARRVVHWLGRTPDRGAGGMDAFRFLARESTLVSQLSEQFKTPREQLPERISAVVTRLRDAERELQRLRAARLLSRPGRSRPAPRTSAGWPWSRTEAPDGTEPDDIPSSRSTCGAGCRATGPRWWRSSACPRTSRSWSSRSTRRAGASACRRVPCGYRGAGPGRERRREAGRGPGRRRPDRGEQPWCYR